MTLKPRAKRRLTRIKEDYEFYRDAERAIVGGAQQYSLGSRSVTKANLKEITDRKKELEDEMDALECPGGRVRRIVPMDK